MLNLFKKNPKPTQSESVLPEVIVSEYDNPKNYPAEVLQIHHEFEAAAGKLLQQANSIIDEAKTIDSTKVSRLEKLGFVKVGQVAELKPILQKAELSKEQIELLNYYRINYPLSKFIAEAQVKEICHKYNLVCGEVNRFTGFVPEKNLREIEGFKLKEKEQNCLVFDNGLVFENAEIRRVNGWFHIFKIDGDPYDFSFQSEDGVRFYGTPRSRNPFNLPSDLWVQSMEVKKGFQICAPVKDMDISGLELSEGYKLQKKHIPDPVVLQPVKGGYLIVTAWGDEASDPIVVNPINQ